MRIALDGESPLMQGVVEVEDGALSASLTTRFSITSNSDTSDAVSLDAEWLRPSGQVCARASAAGPPLTADQPLRLETTRVDVTCPLPFAVEAVRASVHLGGTVFRTTFGVRCDFVALPSTPNTAPTITSLDWATDMPLGGDCPYPGETVHARCSARDEDADGLALEIRLRNLGPGEIVGQGLTRNTFPRSSEARDIEADFWFEAPMSDVKATCVAVDEHGTRTQEAIVIACRSKS